MGGKIARAFPAGKGGPAYGIYNMHNSALISAEFHNHLITKIWRREKRYDPA